MTEEIAVKICIGHTPYVSIVTRPHPMGHADYQMFSVEGALSLLGQLEAMREELLDLARSEPRSPEQIAQIQPDTRIIGEPITPLYEHLATFVPLEIMELQKSGGPTDWHFEEIKRRRQAMRDDPGLDESLLYIVGKGCTASSVGFLVECLAVMAFLPGGVKFGALRFWANKESDLSQIATRQE